jgi:hypothetical protein
MRFGEFRTTDGDLRVGLEWRAYPDFGLYVFRSERVHLLVRCGWAMQDGSGVHAHEDQLAVDLTLDGVPVTQDPGTYVYESSHASRNAYRSASAHAAPSTRVEGTAGVEGGEGVFGPPRHGDGRCLVFEGGRFVGRAIVDGGWVTRTVSLRQDGVEITDEYDLLPPWIPAPVGLFVPPKPVTFSPTYGVRKARKT